VPYAWSGHPGIARVTEDVSKPAWRKQPDDGIFDFRKGRGIFGSLPITTYRKQKDVTHDHSLCGVHW
jgi:hypothetical protein